MKPNKKFAQQRLNQLKEQREKIRGTKWLYIRNEEGELLYRTLNSGDVGKQIMCELDESIEYYENISVTTEKGDENNDL